MGPETEIATVQDGERPSCMVCICHLVTTLREKEHGPSTQSSKQHPSPIVETLASDPSLALLTISLVTHALEEESEEEQDYFSAANSDVLCSFLTTVVMSSIFSHRCIVILAMRADKNEK